MAFSKKVSSWRVELHKSTYRYYIGTLSDGSIFIRAEYTNSIIIHNGVLYCATKRKTYE